jgi:tRNA pseudouridine38-40 synthase
MNLRLTIAYDGTNYQGWQLQANEKTVQGEISAALTRLDGEPVVVHGAGRTDAGVHALGQVASVRLTRARLPGQVLSALNGSLSREIRIVSAEQVSEDFNARFHARSKTYRYQIYNAPVMNPLLERYAFHYPFEFNDDALSQQAQSLIGVHDFSAFTVSGCEVKSRVRSLFTFSLKREGPLVKFEFSGNGFLRHQVRTMVVALLDTTRGRLGSLTIADLLEQGDRGLTGMMVPAKGLTLMKVEY